MKFWETDTWNLKATPRTYGDPIIDRRDSLDPDVPWREVATETTLGEDFGSATIPMSGESGSARLRFLTPRLPLFSGIDNAALSGVLGNWFIPFGVNSSQTSYREIREALVRAFGPWTLAQALTRLSEARSIANTQVGLGDFERETWVNHIEGLMTKLPAVYPSPPSPPSDPGCGDDAGCTYTVVHVAASASDGGDGSPGAPFKTIAAALAHGQSISACGVEIQLAAGNYAENFEVIRHTRIIGGATRPILKSMITSRGAHVLTLRDLEVHGEPYDPTVLVDENSWAVFSDHRCGYVVLDRVRILNSVGPGVWVRQGRLYASDLVVDGSHGRLSGFLDGTGDGWGVLVDQGAHAVLVGVELARNRVGGLLAHGRGTEVHLQRLITHHNLWTAFHGEGVVVAWEDARMLVECASFSRDENSFALGGMRRSKVYGRFIRIEDQLGRPCRDGDCVVFPGGIGLGSYEFSSVDVACFDITRMLFLGAQLATGGGIDLRAGRISRSPIGFNQQTFPFDLLRVQSNHYFENETDLDAARLTAPEAE